MELILELIYYIFFGLGAFVFWIGKGCKTSFNDELMNYNMRNGLVATSLFLAPFIILLIYLFLND
ncbi:hypothetical protein KKF63_11935 [bacterium]|nr:hypothetical protein [bacterium]